MRAAVHHGEGIRVLLDSSAGGKVLIDTGGRRQGFDERAGG